MPRIATSFFIEEKWKIVNFTSLWDNITDSAQPYVEGELIIEGNCNRPLCTVKLYPMGCDAAHRDYVSLEVKRNKLFYCFDGSVQIVHPAGGWNENYSKGNKKWMKIESIFFEI